MNTKITFAALALGTALFATSAMADGMAPANGGMAPASGGMAPATTTNTMAPATGGMMAPMKPKPMKKMKKKPAMGGAMAPANTMAPASGGMAPSNSMSGSH
jgi:hypothetical protein